MLKKSLGLLVSFILLLSLAIPTQSSAAPAPAPVKIFIDGKEISADQPPIIKDGRTLVPLRAIFEGLQATVDFNAKTKVITAKRGSTTVVLTLGSKKATINGKAVQLDVPAQTLKNRTLVPARFVSESLGDQISYDEKSRKVIITTKNDSVSNLTVKDVNDYGDGRDVQFSFTKAKDDSQIDHYRAAVVKTSKLSSFNVYSSLSSNRYITIAKGGTTLQKTFNSNSLDVNGDLIQNDIAYTLIVMSVSKNNVVLSSESTSFVLTGKLKVSAATGVKLKDASDYGDGRDLEVSFNKIADESNLVQYRAIIVRENEASSFNLSTAIEVSSSNYTAISKSGANIKRILSSTTRDSQGRLIQSGIPYKLFILSVGNQSRSYSSSLSTASASVTLSSNPEDTKVTKLSVSDIYDYGNGADLQVSFTAPANDTRVSEYRIFVVREADAKNFNLTKAEDTSSSYYTSVSRSSSSTISVTLSSSARDVSGYYIQNDVAYKVFVMSVGTQANSYKNSLSAASSTIRLTDNQITKGVSNIVVKDSSDWGDGRDLEVSFNKVSDESKISEYRIMVIKSAQAGGFNLKDANSTRHYLSVSKTGANIKRTLLADSRDVYGEIIREDVAYRVYVLAVSSGGNSNNNALSAPSAAITLTSNASTQAVTNVKTAIAGYSGTASDIEVSFNKVSDESTISEYRAMVVKSEDAWNFNLRSASSANYMTIAKTGKNITTRLNSNITDVNGRSLNYGQNYVVFILSKSNSGNSDALSGSSNDFSLADGSVQAATDVRVYDVDDYGDGRDLEVSFTRADSESNISYYDILVVPASKSFYLSDANRVTPENRTRISKADASTATTLSMDTTDVEGRKIRSGDSYRVYILSIANGNNASINALSVPSDSIRLD